MEIITNKASGLLAILRRQVKFTSRKTRLTLYKTVVRSILEYASCVWSPYLQKHVDLVEGVQRKAVRWISHLGRFDSVMDAMESLDLQSLEARRKLRDLEILEKILSDSMDLSLNCHMNPSTYNTRGGLIQQSTSTAPYFNLFLSQLSY